MSSSSYNPNITLTSLSTQQGEINLVTNPIAENDVSSWTTSSATLTRSTTGVLSPVIPTGFTASSTTSTNSYVQTSLLTVPATLRNRKLKVQLYIQCADTATWEVDVLKSDGSTRYTLSTDSSGVSALPALTGTYTTTFDMDTGSGIYVRLTRYAGSGTSTLSFTNLIVGPGIQPQGAVVSLYSRDTTFTIGASITPPTTGAGAAYFREVIREGSDAIIRWEYYQTGAGSAGSGNYRLPLPTGLTVDLTRYREASDTYRNGYLFSSGFLNTSTSTFSALAAVESVASPTYVTMQLFNDANNNLDWGSTTGSLSSAGTLGLTLTARVPIAEWSGSGTVQLAQNDTEFAFNSSTTTTSDTTSFAYGPAGVAFTAMAPSGVNTIEKRVRFQTPIQTTDAVILEVFNGVNWTQAEQALGAYLTNDAASVGYGQLIRPVSGTTTDVSVLFASAASGQSAWNTLATTGWRWRVRKSSAGAAVGFGIVSSQSAGLLPVSNSNLDDATATRLGLKQYLHGTTYNGGIAPTITLGGGGGTLSSVDLGSFMPYQTQDGTWKLKVSIVVTVSSAVRTLAALDVVGISVGTLQGVYGLTSTSPLTATSYVSNNRFQIDHSSSTTTKYYFSGEVVLSSKPTWAY